MLNSIVPTNWASDLSAPIAEALGAFIDTHPDEPISVFSIGCYPWHGSIELSLLTTEEELANPELQSFREMAAWKYYHFAKKYASWKITNGLGRQMKDVYYDDEDTEPNQVTLAFLKACSTAVASSAVAEKIDRLNRSKGFRITITHPDTGEEFFQS
jgi:hypothetical protein